MTAMTMRTDSNHTNDPYVAAQEASTRQNTSQRAAKRRRNRPYMLTTPHTWRRRILTTIAIVLVIGGAWLTASVMSGAIPSPIAVIRDAIGGNGTAAQDTATDATSDAETPAADANEATTTATSTASMETPQNACNALNGYYEGLAAQDATKLHAVGADTAASAVERGWLSRMHYTVGNIGTATADRLPDSAGTYAGSTLYRIADFYPAAGDDAITSDITGKTGLVGWIWYDQTDNAWEIIDPTIPTAVYMPKATSTKMRNTDGNATVTINTDGALANPWWAWMQESVTIATGTTVTVSKRQLDTGVTITTTPGLIGSSIGSGTGTVTIVRGSTTSFGTEKIGQSALKLTGDIAGVTIQAGGQDITPDIAVGE